ncbi:MAG: hypothetical protein HC808_08690 [Candidatus Competibacteraceae bacterium]|nr:hypothetical protein [Candidatus Competibacteraceae bacterium]
MAKFFSPPDNSDVQTVVDTASVLHVSEFDVFRLAYEKWFGHPAAHTEIDKDFTQYMNREIVPMWVRAFTRQVRRLSGAGLLNLREFGIEPAPSATYRTALLGGMAFALIVMVVVLLVYFAVQGTEFVAATGCRLPPCY